MKEYIVRILGSSVIISRKLFMLKKFFISYLRSGNIKFECLSFVLIML